MFESKFIPFLVVTTISFVAHGVYSVTKADEFLAFVGYLLISVLAYFLTNKMIPIISILTVKADIFGYDINKKGNNYHLISGTPGGSVKIPESLGIVPATIYLAFNILGILFTRLYMPNLVLAHTSALLSISFIVFLGFADDVLDLTWRYKLILPPIASLPVIVAYTGGTSVVLPHFIRPYLGITLDVGPLYYIYMSMLATF